MMDPSENFPDFYGLSNLIHLFSSKSHDITDLFRLYSTINYLTMYHIMYIKLPQKNYQKYEFGVC